MGRHRVCVCIADAQQPESRLAQSGDERRLGGRRTRTASRQAVERGRTTCGGVGEQQVRREQATRELRDQHRAPATPAAATEAPHGSPSVQQGRDLMLCGVVPSRIWAITICTAVSARRFVVMPAA